jgi:hypothetical protein
MTVVAIANHLRIVPPLWSLLPLPAANTAAMAWRVAVAALLSYRGKREGVMVVSVTTLY